jgi:hypothetical protein
MSRIEGLHASIITTNLAQRLSKIGHAFFTSGDHNLNIIGVRNTSNKADIFDDLLLVAYKDESKWVVDSYVITTEPGDSILRNPINKDGTAILVPGQYRGVYKIDQHRSRTRDPYAALCQRLGPVKIWRDNNKDSKPDHLGAEEAGNFGINIHRHWKADNRIYTRGASAGCQVFQKSYAFYEFIETCNTAAAIWGNKFTYTLVTQDDFE